MPVLVRRFLGAAILAAGLASGSPAWSQDTRPMYPATPQHPVTDHYFGNAVVDPYRWLEAGDSPEVKRWAAAQTALTRGVLDKLPSREPLRARMLELGQAERQEPPVHRGPYYFFRKQTLQLPQAVLMVREGDGPARPLVDANPLSADGTVSLDWWEASPEGRYVAYGLSEGGNEQSVLHLIDTKTGHAAKDVIPGCRYASVAWLSDEQGFYYTRFPGLGATGQDKQRVYFHRIGDDPAHDAVVFEPHGGPEQIMWVQASHDDRWVLVTVSQGSNTKTEMYLLDRHAPELGLRAIQQGFDAYYSADLHAGRLYLRTDLDAPNGKVMTATFEEALKHQWQDLVPEGPDAMQGAFVAGGKLVVEYLHNALSQVRLYELNGRPAGEIAFPGLGTVSGLSGGEDDPQLFFSYTSYLSPAAVYRYDLHKAQVTPIFQPDLHIDASRYQEEQVWYTSKDGTRVPMMLVHKKGLKRDGQNPVLLTAYGGFDISLTPAFSISHFAWIEAGGVLAVPNLRGGGEFGAAWHEAGMQDRKQNVFDDFYAAAEWLIRERVTSTPKLGIEGGSNGGLLMGAAITQRPELFKAVICAVPLLDMLRFHRFLIARYWIPEYGSSEDAHQYKALAAYSPYQHVKAGVHYPATLIVTGESDTRVDPLHARKMAALLQRDQGGPAPIYLYVESKAGHGAGKPLTKRIETSADQLGFLAWQLGLDVKPKEAHP